MAPGETLKGKALLAIDLNNEDEFQLLANYRQGRYKLEVRATQTRAGVAKECTLNAEDEAVVRIEQPQCRTPSLVSDESPMVEQRW